MPLKFEHANYLFLVQRFFSTFYDPAENAFKFFAKITKGSCAFCCSSCISFNPTGHLKGQPFLSKITGYYCHWLLVELFFPWTLYALISNFLCKDRTFKSIWSGYYELFLNWTYWCQKLCFISVWAWLKNLHIKSCIEDLTVMILSYFYKNNRDENETWKSSLKKVILVTSQYIEFTHVPFSYVFAGSKSATWKSKFKI